MCNTWYISDTHFSHRKICKFEGEARPFASWEEHDEELIRRWNSVVEENDLVIHLGDVVFQPALRLEHVMLRLKGTKQLIMGNHDVAPNSEYLRFFKSVHGSLEDKKHGVIFSHYPVHHGQLRDRYRYNVHGHCHSSVVRNYLGEADERYINICVEHINLTPISKQDLYTKMGVKL